MRETWLVARSAALWTLSVLHFFPFGGLLVLLGRFRDPRSFDPLVRLFMRNQLRLTGARLEVRAHPAFDPGRTCFFVCNHVNLFDPFVAYSAVPQFLRGLELESHFRVPVYGWMMKSFGNVPVPVDRNPAGLREMRRRCAEALGRGTSLLAFPEGHRTRSGRVGPFRLGVFRMARELDVPVVPMTQEGAFRLQRVGNPLLRPATIVVHLHEPLRPRHDESDAAFRDRVRAVVAGPLGEPPPADRNQPAA